MTITINGKNYETKEFDFAALVKIEDCGVTLEDLTSIKKPLNLIVALVAWITNKSKNDAIKEINDHLENGGSLEDLTKVAEDIKNSDFFQKAMKH